MPFGLVDLRTALRRKALRLSTLKLTGDGKARPILAAMFPTLHAEVEAGWQMLIRLPYTIGYARRAFRAPHRPEIYQKRHSYLKDIFNWCSNYRTTR